MKKVIFLMSALLGIFSLVYGQPNNLRVLRGGDDGNGDVTGMTVYHWTDNSTRIEKQFNIKNTSSANINVRMVRKNVSVQSGTVNGYCWDLCPPDPGPDTAGIVTVNQGATTGILRLIAHYIPNGQSGQSTVKYKFFDDANPADSAFVIVVYNSSSTGIDNQTLKENAISSVYPNPASSSASLNYNLEGYNQRAKIVLYNMLGNTVKEYSIANTQGTLNINTGELPNGVYFYALSSSENKAFATKRLVVNH